MPSIRVLIADDHPGMVAALESVLEDDERFTVVGAGATGEDALRLAAELRPDLVLLDVSMPGGGADAAQALLDLPGGPPVVVALSAHSGAAVVETMLRAGVVGYLTKGHVGDSLPDLLARCAAGEVVLSTPAAAGALRSVLRAAQPL